MCKHTDSTWALGVSALGLPHDQGAMISYPVGSFVDVPLRSVARAYVARPGIGRIPFPSVGVKPWHHCRGGSNPLRFSVGEVYSRIEPDDIRPRDGWSLGLSKIFE